MKVPREIDELMWEVAEANDPTLESQFVARYPSFGPELEKRKSMVADLRGSRPSREPALFVPSREVRNFGPSRTAVVLASCVLLASVAFATVATVRYLSNKRIDEPVLPPVRPAMESSLPVKEPAPDEEFQAIPQSGAIGTFPAEATETQRVDPYLQQVTVRSERILLSDVISEIASQASLSVTVGPGFEDKTIFIVYENQPAIGVLNDLGRRYGFTAFPQGGRDVLIIPARGSGSINETSASGVANEVKEEQPKK